VEAGKISFDCAVKDQRATKSECVVCFAANKNQEQDRPYCEQIQRELPEVRRRRDR